MPSRISYPSARRYADFDVDSVSVSAAALLSVSPAYAKAAGTMVFNRFTGLGEEDIITGAYDIRESRSEEILEPGEGTLIIMPGAVFTPWKDRIGYGGGFYDRFLDEHPECKTIAVCYDLQVVDELPVEAHDRKPDYVVCETSVFR